MRGCWRADYGVDFVFFCSLREISEILTFFLHGGLQKPKKSGTYPLVLRRGTFFVFLTLCCVLFFSWTASGEWIVRMQEEAPAAWTSYINAWNNTSVEFTERGMVGNDVVTDICGFLVFSCPNVSQHTTDNLTSLTTVVVSNINYEFALTRMVEKTWNIEMVQNDHAVSAKNSLQFPLMSAMSVDNPLATSELFVGRNFARGLMVSVADWFPNVFNQPEFQILDTGAIIEDNKTLVRIRYSYSPQQRPNQLIRDGEIYFLPDHYWLMKRANLELVEPDGARLRASIICEYDFQMLCRVYCDIRSVLESTIIHFRGVSQIILSGMRYLLIFSRLPNRTSWACIRFGLRQLFPIRSFVPLRNRRHLPTNQQKTKLLSNETLFPCNHFSSVLHFFGTMRTESRIHVSLAKQV